MVDRSQTTARGREEVVKQNYFFITKTNHCYGYPKGTRVDVRVLYHVNKRIAVQFRNVEGELLDRKLAPSTLQKEDAAGPDSLMHDLDVLTEDMESIRLRLVSLLRTYPDLREISVARTCVNDALGHLDDQRKACRKMEEERQ